MKPREIAACGRGASSVTRKQLRDCAIDSQVLIVIGLPQSGRAKLAKRYSFDIIRAIEFAAPKDFISLKP
ncbi:RES domain-containing protein [Pseudomonas sp. IT-P260]